MDEDYTTILYLSHTAADQPSAIEARLALIHAAMAMGFEVIGSDTETEPREAAVARIMESLD